MFRFVFALFAAVALASLFVGGGDAFLLAPFLLFGKFLFVMMLFGVVGGGFARSRRWEPQPPAGPAAPTDEEFDEWHRMAHAREEVDGWVDHVE